MKAQFNGETCIGRFILWSSTQSSQKNLFFFSFTVNFEYRFGGRYSCNPRNIRIQFFSFPRIFIKKRFRHRIGFDGRTKYARGIYIPYLWVIFSFKYLMIDHDDDDNNNNKASLRTSASSTVSSTFTTSVPVFGESVSSSFQTKPAATADSYNVGSSSSTSAIPSATFFTSKSSYPASTLLLSTATAATTIDLTMNTKIRLMEMPVFSLLSYKLECWTLKGIQHIIYHCALVYLRRQMQICGI